MIKGNANMYSQTNISNLHQLKRNSKTR